MLQRSSAIPLTATEDVWIQAHQSHEVATHSNVINAKFFAENKRVISGHIHLNGTIDYSGRARSGGEAGQVPRTTAEVLLLQMPNVKE
jgi:hypothetical protein